MIIELGNVKVETKTGGNSQITDVNPLRFQ
jgi:hypothetical protein